MKRILASVAPPFMVLAVVGLALILGGLLLKTVIHELIFNLIEAVGVASLAVAFTSPISAYFQYKLTAEQMDLVRGAVESGVIRIFSSRDWDPKVKDAITAAISEAEELKVACIGFPTFVRHPFPPAVQDRFYNTEFKMRFLLLNPEGEDAAERSTIEIGRRTLIDIGGTLATLKNIMEERLEQLGINVQGDQKNLEKMNVEVHLYDFPPIAFLLITDKLMIIEQYHFGRLDSFVKGECIGGKVPLLMLGNHSLYYKLLNAHFDYVWKEKSKPFTKELLAGTAPSDSVRATV